jgi:hypothetical protein
MSQAAVAEAFQVGLSNEVPDEILAYQLVHVDEDGAAMLGRDDGAADTEDLDDVSSCRQALAHMTDAVLAQMPAELRGRARTALARRWKRDWGIEDLP